MQIISSKDNKIVKEASSLAEKKYRDELSRYLVEGPNIVKEAMQLGNRVRFIFTRAGFSDAETNEIVSLAQEKGLAVYELFSDVFAKVTQTSNPQPIAAVIDKRQMSKEEFFDAVGNKNILVLDRLQDPGNVGTLLRSAEAMGFGGAIILKGTADVFQPKLVRAAAGTVLRFPMLFADTADELLAMLKEHNIKAYATAMNAKISCFDTDLKSKAAVIIGNEGNGVCDELLNKVDTVFIPMEGKTESLNAAVCGAMIMYESLRQRR